MDCTSCLEVSKTFSVTDVLNIVIIGHVTTGDHFFALTEFFLIKTPDLPPANVTHKTSGLTVKAYHRFHIKMHLLYCEVHAGSED